MARSRLSMAMFTPAQKPRGAARMIFMSSEAPPRHDSRWGRRRERPGGATARRPVGTVARPYHGKSGLGIERIAGDGGLDFEEGFAGGDVERFFVRAAEGEVGEDVFRDGNAAEEFAGWRKD